MNHYTALGIPTDADDQVIRSAFRALARRYHPDAGAEASPEKFRVVAEAYEILSSPRLRADYDRSLQPRRVPAPFEPLSAPIEPIGERRRRVSSTYYAEQMIDDMLRTFTHESSRFPSRNLSRLIVTFLRVQRP